jgi:hypothetical protein
MRGMAQEPLGAQRAAAWTLYLPCARATNLLAVPRSYVVPDTGNRSAPLMLAALTGIVHDRERTDGYERTSDKDNDQRGLHDDLALRVPEPPRSDFRYLKMNPR